MAEMTALQKKWADDRKETLPDVEEKFPHGAWCKKGDWVVFARYAGARINIEDGEIRILNDDEILATIKDPEDVIHMV